MADKPVLEPGPDHPITITPTSGRVVVTATVWKPFLMTFDGGRYRGDAITFMKDAYGGNARPLEDYFGFSLGALDFLMNRFYSECEPREESPAPSGAAAAADTDDFLIDLEPLAVPEPAAAEAPAAEEPLAPAAHDDATAAAHGDQVELEPAEFDLDALESLEPSAEAPAPPHDKAAAVNGEHAADEEVDLEPVGEEPEQRIPRKSGKGRKDPPQLSAARWRLALFLGRGHHESLGPRCW